MATKTKPPTLKSCPHCAKPLEAAKPTSERLRKGYIEAVKRAGGVWCASCYAYMAPTHTCYTPAEWRAFRDRETEKVDCGTHRGAQARDGAHHMTTHTQGPTCKDCKPTAPPFVNWNDAPVILCPLHTAAPEMLEALERLTEHARLGQDGLTRNGLIREARAVIAKARREAQ